MSGWIALALLGLATVALLWRMGVARLLWPLIGAALMLGAAGYAWQGSPGLAGSPVASGARDLSLDPSLLALRGAMLTQYGQEGAFLGLSDALLRTGDATLASDVLVGGIRATPDSAALWTDFGLVLAIHDGDQVSPAALLAFDHAMRLAPTLAGPPFFLGIAYVRAGQFAAARPCWVRALRLAPAGASYRAAIAERLALLDGYLAQGAPPDR